MICDKILFLDCDGTIRRPKSGATFINVPEDQEIIEGVHEAIAHYKSLGFLPIGVTNQGGVASGHKSLKSAIQEQEYTLKLLPALNFIYFAPTYDGLICWKIARNIPTEIKQQSIEEFGSFRKPGSGMLNLALRFYNIEPSKCLMVGDRTEDEEAASAASVPFIWAEDFCKSPIPPTV